MYLQQLLRITVSRPFGNALKHLSKGMPLSHQTLSYATSTHSLFNYTHAITREVPKTFVEHALKMDETEEIVFPRTVEQWKKYVEALKKCGLKVITLPTDDRYPDCVFVEDAAVVIGQKACLTRPGHPNRRGEVPAVEEALRKLGITIVELDDPAALLDGGDVMFTGQEIMVGQSTRSNKAAVDSLQRAFPDFPVTPIPVEGTLHLKSVSCLAKEGVILVGSSQASNLILKEIQSRAQGQYNFIRTSNDSSANVLYINNHTVMKAEKEIGSADYKMLTAELKMPVVPVEFSEFYKADGCLSCASILLRVP